MTVSLSAAVIGVVLLALALVLVGRFLMSKATPGQEWLADVGAAAIIIAVLVAVFGGLGLISLVIGAAADAFVAAHG